VILLALAAFLIWRFVRPIHIFTVLGAFERPIPTDGAPAMFTTLSAEECAACHHEFYDEWKTSIHSRAWTDPYFQADWRFDDEPQICKNCHTPLDRQQAHRVLGFRDKDKWDPILAPNPDFDPELQHEGVTCAVCHLRDGFILGPYGEDTAPHPVKKMANPDSACVRCHVVPGERWDTFYRMPPCGTVAEIGRGKHGEQKGVDSAPRGSSVRPREIVVEVVAGLGCVQCHMPLMERPLVPGGEMRSTRRHLWRGGHDTEMVQRGLEIMLEEDVTSGSAKRHVTLTLTNVGAAHFLPTGTPDRHLTVALRLRDGDGRVLKEQFHVLKRTILWRPFIIDLWDTRLPYGEPHSYRLEFASDITSASVEAEVRYHLLDEKRRRRIGYRNREPISYEVFRQSLSIDARPNAHDPL
jgi:hypothetical protein